MLGTGPHYSYFYNVLVLYIAVVSLCLDDHSSRLESLTKLLNIILLSFTLGLHHLQYN